ncbi:hypothetical protein HHK36_028739 [Tetracentron sinense]|uniref:Uncharacterized protein n=1 Tax=Tetracentron sinense TaxID=13715 RepID=A0A834YFY9_TETSI|nr:hypothetical protein HHK36_028739 [Tetracentron sinense]
MKLVWSPETASKAYIDTVKSVSSLLSSNPDNSSSNSLTLTKCFRYHDVQCELFEESSVSELVSAMAGGWSAKLIVETWSQGGVIATSIGLAIASRHTCGRHVCVVPDECSRSAYVEAMREAGISPEVIVGEAEEVMGGLLGIDFLVVDCKREDFARILRVAKLSHRGAVLVCKNASLRIASGLRWCSLLDSPCRVVRSAFLPLGKGLEITHVATSGGSLSSAKGSLVKDLLIQQGLHKTLKGKSKKSESMSDDKWEDLELQATSTIRLSLSDDVLYHVVNEYSALKLLMKLESLYMTNLLSKRLFLKQKLHTLKMKECGDLTKHMNAFNKVVNDLASIDKKFSDENFVLQLFFSLPSSYEHLDTTLLYDNDTRS